MNQPVFRPRGMPRGPFPPPRPMPGPPPHMQGHPPRQHGPPRHPPRLRPPPPEFGMMPPRIVGRGLPPPRQLYRDISSGRGPPSRELQHSGPGRGSPMRRRPALEPFDRPSAGTSLLQNLVNAQLQMEQGRLPSSDGRPGRRPTMPSPSPGMNKLYPPRPNTSSLEFYPPRRRHPDPPIHPEFRMEYAGGELPPREGYPESPRRHMMEPSPQGIFKPIPQDMHRLMPGEHPLLQPPSFRPQRSQEDIMPPSQQYQAFSNAAKRSTPEGKHAVGRKRKNGVGDGSVVPVPSKKAKKKNKKKKKTVPTASVAPAVESLKETASGPAVTEIDHLKTSTAKAVASSDPEDGEIQEDTPTLDSKEENPIKENMQVTEVEDPTPKPDSDGLKKSIDILPTASDAEEGEIFEEETPKPVVAESKAITPHSSSAKKKNKKKKKKGSKNDSVSAQGQRPLVEGQEMSSPHVNGRLETPLRDPPHRESTMVQAAAEDELEDGELPDEKALSTPNKPIFQQGFFKYADVIPAVTVARGRTSSKKPQRASDGEFLPEYVDRRSTEYQPSMLQDATDDKTLDDLRAQVLLTLEASKKRKPEEPRTQHTPAASPGSSGPVVNNGNSAGIGVTKEEMLALRSAVLQSMAPKKKKSATRLNEINSQTYAGQEHSAIDSLESKASSSTLMQWFNNTFQEETAVAEPQAKKLISLLTVQVQSLFISFDDVDGDAEEQSLKSVAKKDPAVELQEAINRMKEQIARREKLAKISGDGEASTVNALQEDKQLPPTIQMVSAEAPASRKIRQEPKRSTTYSKLALLELKAAELQKSLLPRQSRLEMMQKLMTDQKAMTAKCEATVLELRRQQSLIAGTLSSLKSKEKQLLESDKRAELAIQMYHQAIQA